MLTSIYYLFCILNNMSILLSIISCIIYIVHHRKFIYAQSKLYVQQNATFELLVQMPVRCNGGEKICVVATTAPSANGGRQIYYWWRSRVGWWHLFNHLLPSRPATPMHLHTFHNNRYNLIA
jgi:hypothetical protein